MNDMMRTWVEINLDNAAHNLKEIWRVSGARVISVVKADAYGHGAKEISRLYRDMGVDYFAVACLSEALELRRAGIDCKILILGVTPREGIAVAAKNRITQTVFSLEYARMVSDAANAAGEDISVHFKVDTGMGRIGFPVKTDADMDLSAREICEASEYPAIVPEGVFTHFADAENTSSDITDCQLGRFLGIVSRLAEMKREFEIVHCANSAAVINYNKAHLGCVRPGLIQYGLYPGGCADAEISLRPVMSFKCVISDVRKIRAGESVSYGASFIAPRDMTVAVLPAGYADGVVRALSGVGEFLLHGKRVPVLGRICMDMCVVDVSHVPSARVGDTVTLFGCDGDVSASADEWADVIGTISYEVCCNISKRVPRVYISSEACSQHGGAV